MNNGVSKEFLDNFSNTIPVVLPRVRSLDVNDINNQWFAGFTDAEGCFYLNIRPNRNKTGYWVAVAFSVVQHSRDTFLFKLLKEFLGGGFITEENNKPVVRYRTENLSFILKVIIPLFNNNILQSQKIKNFISFYMACVLIKDKAHFTKEGLKIIKDIKSNMNTGRTY